MHWITTTHMRTAFVNRAETEGELEALRRSVSRGAPFGASEWQRRMTARLQLESSLRNPWRPKAVPDKGQHEKK